MYIPRGYSIAKWSAIEIQEWCIQDGTQGGCSYYSSFHYQLPQSYAYRMKPSYKTAKIVVHPPVESEGKSEEELAEAVRESLIRGLGDDQKPL